MTKKILISGPAWLGDMVMAQSLFRLLHAKGHTLDVLAPEWNFAVLHRMPEISQAIKMPIEHGELKLGLRRQLGKELQKNQYDQAIVMQNTFKSALIPFFAKIPRRTGYARELRFGLINDIRFLDKKKFPLMVQRCVALGYDKNENWDVTQYPLPRLQVNQEDVRRQFQALELSFPAQKKILALSPGAAFGETKRWPARYFAQVANHYLEQDWTVWIMGSANDVPITNEINQLTNWQCIDLAGKLNLAATVDLLSQASLMLSNDSGLLHVAAALEVPLVGIYGSTSPDFTPPLGKTATTASLPNVECRPCFKRTCKFGHLKCLEDLHPEKIFSAIERVSND